MGKVNWFKRLTGYLTVRMLPVVALILIVFLLSASYVSSIITEKIQLREHQSVANSFTQMVKDTLENARNQVQTIAQNDLIINGLIDTQERSRYIPTFFRSWRISGIKEGDISLYDYKGRLVFSNKSKALGSVNAEVKQAVSSEQAFQKISSDGLVLIEPIRYQYGVEGAVLYTLPQAYLTELFKFTAGKFGVQLFDPKTDQLILETSLTEDVKTDSENITYSYNTQYGRVNTIVSLDNSNQIQKQANIILISSAVLIIIVSIGLSGLSAKLAASTISDLSNQVQAVHDNMNFSLRVDQQNKPQELQDLADKFNNMLSKLEESTLSKDRITSMLDSISAYFVVLGNNKEIILENKSFGYLSSGLNKGDEQSFINTFGEPSHTIMADPQSSLQWQSEISTPAFTNVIEWTRTNFHDDSGKHIGYILVGIDITEKVSKEKELLTAKEEAEVANKTKSEFLANMSHEIRTPMNAIIGMNDLMLSTELQDRQKDYITKSQKSARNLLGLLNDILDFSKIEAGKLEIEHIEFDIYELIESISDLIAVRLKNIKSYIEVDKNLPRWLIGDPLRINQVLTNLMSNALKFTEQGHIDLQICVHKLTPLSVQVEFLVKDTGVGISQDQQDKLFTPFTQADGSTTRKFGGTGLGLSISKVLSELMGGTISVSSEKDVGSTFTVSIPFAISQHASPKKPEPKYSLAYTLISDSHLNAIIGRLLNQFSLQSITIKSAAELDNLSPGFLITDEEGIEQLSSTTLSDNVDIIVLTYQSHRMLLNQKNVPFEHDLVQLPTTYLGLGRAIFVQEKDTTELQDTLALKDCRILVVDDNMINREIAKELLAQLGAIIEEAENGEEAVEKTRTGHFDIVLMDIHMPVMDGYEASYKINKTMAHNAPPIIALSAKAMEEDKQQAEKSGMKGYVSKPFEIAQLCEVISELWHRQTS